jgi:hypothetical protein
LAAVDMFLYVSLTEADLYGSCIWCGEFLVNITITIPYSSNVSLHTNGQMAVFFKCHLLGPVRRDGSLSLSLIPLAFISEELRAKRKKELKKDNASRIKATVDEVYTV